MGLHSSALTWAFFVMLFIFEPLAKWVSIEQWGVSVGFHGSGKAVAEYIVHPLTYFCNGKTALLKSLRLSEEKVKQKLKVSYDYLKEVNCSGAAFLICNASLGLTGKNWLQCRNSVNGRSSKLRNKSPPHAAIDVVRLARHFYEMKQAMRKNVSRCKPWPIGKWSDGYLF
ncbi:hypothetical protein AK812_SmicGene14304 [Symbiodinium microadriaticum]|uniref:Uncharacterized protein n=1 Tax=Symbiodinium microadriaticum TaxID=2951 RepID=A0A1Q9E5X0_SYMMI|nr:hypothetical protein AK812_SmicGene14304 [Symbiodinium microadriaticum]